jgi:hypothetical protein
MHRERREGMKEDLLYVELPNLVNRIMKQYSKPDSKDAIYIVGEEIKKVVNAEVESAITTYESLTGNCFGNNG